MCFSFISLQGERIAEETYNYPGALTTMNTSALQSCGLMPRGEAEKVGRFAAIAVARPVL
jgi:hypothetical protein